MRFFRYLLRKMGAKECPIGSKRVAIIEDLPCGERITVVKKTKALRSPKALDDILFDFENYRKRKGI